MNSCRVIKSHPWNNMWFFFFLHIGFALSVCPFVCLSVCPPKKLNFGPNFLHGKCQDHLLRSRSNIKVTFLMAIAGAFVFQKDILTNLKLFDKLKLVNQLVKSCSK